MNRFRLVKVTHPDEEPYYDIESNMHPSLAGDAWNHYDRYSILEDAIRDIKILNKPEPVVLREVIEYD